MKFAQYLESSQTAEWKKAYIDYKGLKKLITKVRESKLESPGLSIRSTAPSQPLGSPHPTPSSNQNQSQPRRPGNSPGYGSFEHTPPLNSSMNVSMPSAINMPPPAQPLPSIEEGPGPRIMMLGDDLPNAQQGPPRVRKVSYARSQSDDIIARSTSPPNQNTTNSDVLETPDPNASPRGRRTLGSIIKRRPTRKSSRSTFSEQTFQSLGHLYTALTPQELAFFEKLDGEVEKVDGFYSEHQKDAQIRFSTLKEQLHELKEHRKIFYESQPDNQTWSISRVLDVAGLNAARFRASNSHTGPGLNHSKSRESSRGAAFERNPEEYQHAKKKLKEALLEFYRLLELLKNYRIINATGFRKALKKFDKTAQLNTQDLYLREMVHNRPVSSGDQIDNMLKDVENLYAARFAQGNRKHAQDRLRAHYREHSHHMSTFKSGMLIGLGIPAFALGLYESYRPEVREMLPHWSALLYIYATLFVPLLFALLIGINTQVWRLSRINWVFIFELDVRTAIDTRRMFEIPAFLLSTLLYAFWVSFSLITQPHFDPMKVPLLWILLAIATILNPLPTAFKPTRLWFLRVVGRLFVPGTQRVEFTDFWLGDQFCSLVFTTTGLYFLSCAYITNFRDPWNQCTTTRHNWGYYFLLGALPNIIRLIQSIKRYVDSKLYTHLINAGKYTSSCVYYMAYYLWRSRNSQHDWRFGIWILFGIIMSSYTSSWDLLMDWSLLNPHAKNPFLRDSLMYQDWKPLYFFAIFSDVVIRFIWMIYIPTAGLNNPLRAFIAALLEMLRRWQWNFYRLENEHIGNTDQYRVTREVPLPYHIDLDNDAGSDNDSMVQLPEMDENGRISSGEVAV